MVLIHAHKNLEKQEIVRIFTGKTGENPTINKNKSYVEKN